jgi:hypothetical protein
MPRSLQISSTGPQLRQHNDFLTPIGRADVHRRAVSADDIVVSPAGFVRGGEEARKGGALRAKNVRATTEADCTDSRACARVRLA